MDQYIEIDKTLIPYQFDIDLSGETYTFGINYNERFDFFTFDISKGDDVILNGEKLILNKQLFSGNKDQRLPQNIYLIPLDESGTETRITWDNLNSKIYIFIGEDAA